MSIAARPKWGAIVVGLMVVLVLGLFQLGRRSVTPAGDRSGALRSSSESNADVSGVRVDARAAQDQDQAQARVAEARRVTYVEGTNSWCDGEDTRALMTAAECAAAADTLGVISHQVAQAVHRVDSTLLPAGCYYKRELPSFYHNFLNKSLVELEAAGRLFLNVGRDPLGPRPPPPPPGNQSLRVALCKVAVHCGVDAQWRSCDDWIHEFPGHQQSCALLEAYGLDCGGCSCTAAAPPGCDDPRLHCRHEKALRKKQSHYSAAANAVGSEVIRSARIVAVGDTHGRHGSIGPIPPGDVFIHTGDIVSGTSTDPATVRAELAAFNAWLGRLPHKRKFFVAGNHDAHGGVSLGELSSLVPNAVQLLDSREEVDLDGDGLGELTVWGAPWQPQFRGFGTYVSPSEIVGKWAQIPSGVDVVVTHTPPRGELDLNEEQDHVGCVALAARLADVNPALSLFGHIHSGRVGGRGCCKAMTATCMACAADWSVKEFCRRHPSTTGCDAASIERGESNTDRPIKTVARGKGRTTYANVASMPGKGMDHHSEPRNVAVFDVPFSS
jgi:hypothetical protein